MINTILTILVICWIVGFCMIVFAIAKAGSKKVFGILKGVFDSHGVTSLPKQLAYMIGIITFMPVIMLFISNDKK